MPAVRKKDRECWACAADWEYRLYGAGASVPEVRSCREHAGDSVAALLAARASMVMVPGSRKAAAGRYPAPDHVLEMARRAGAHSRDQRRLEVMERELHVAVLAAIADGAPMAPQLAAAALTTLNYGHERERS
jgi:hypothetical protein